MSDGLNQEGQQVQRTQTLETQPWSTCWGRVENPTQGPLCTPENILTSHSRRPSAQGSDWSTPASALPPHSVGHWPVTDPRNLGCSGLVPLAFTPTQSLPSR